MATVMLQQSKNELTALMRAVVERIDATKRGEPVPQFDNDHLTALLCCIGDSLIAYHRAMRRC